VAREPFARLAAEAPGHGGIDACARTLVTALRGHRPRQLAGPFARSFEDHYVPMFERLLSADLPMVIYLDLKHADIVWAATTSTQYEGRSADRGDAQGFPYFDRVQEIRGPRRVVFADGMAAVEPAGGARVLQPARDVEDAVARRSGRR